jgi:hypothetical protein
VEGIASLCAACHRWLFTNKNKNGGEDLIPPPSVENKLGKS